MHALFEETATVCAEVFCVDELNELAGRCMSSLHVQVALMAGALCRSSPSRLSHDQVTVSLEWRRDEECVRPSIVEAKEFPDMLCWGFQGACWCQCLRVPSKFRGHISSGSPP